MMNKTPSAVKIDSKPIALILGGAGFIGSHLCDSLIAQNSHVICVDQLNKFKENNIAHLRGKELFSLADQSDKVEKKINYVFCLEKKYASLIGNFPDSRWLFFSSHFEEEIINQASRQKLNFRFVCARQLFGSRMNLAEKDFFSSLVKGIQKEQKILLPGDGSMKIYPLFISDLISGLTTAMFMPQSKAQVFYFAGEKITVFSFAKLWVDFWPEIEISFAKEIDIPRLGYLSEAKTTQSELGWKLTHSLKEGVEKTIGWLQRGDIQKIWSVKKKTEVKRSVAEEEAEIKTEKENEEKRLNKIEAEKTASKKEKTIPEENGLWLSRETEEPSQKIEPLIMSIENIAAESAPIKKKTSKEKKHRPRWPIIGLIIVSFLLIIMPFLLLTKDSFSAAKSLEKSQAICLEGNLSICRQQTEITKKKFIQARNTSQKLTPILLKITGQNFIDQFSKYLTLGAEAAEALNYFAQAGEKSQEISNQIIREKSNANFDALLSETDQLVERAYFNLSQVLATSQNITIPGPYQKTFSQLPATIKDLELTMASLPALRQFLEQENQTLLVLLQNNMELRSTGGFIGSYGLMTFQKGHLISFTVHDVYEADGQLHGQVEPPATLKKYLGEENWYLRDSNWSPDFPTSAKQAIWFFEKEKKQLVDGVLAINLNVVQRILATTGEIYLPDYEETINEKNLFERAEYHSEVGFFPGSEQKKNFLANLSFEIFEQIHRNEISSTKLFLAFKDSLIKRDCLIYFSNPDMEASMIKLELDGAIKSLNCQKENCFSDYLLAVDNNVGANKANFFVKRRLVQRIEIKKDIINHGLQISWQNTAQTDNWPGGKYKNYFRLYLPITAQIQDAFLTEGSSHRKAINLEMEEKDNKKIANILISVPIKTSLVLEVNYQLKANYQNDKKKRLAFLVQKQSGGDWQEDITLFTYPKNWLPAQIEPEGDLSTNAITYRNFLDRDRLFELEWGEIAEGQ